MNASDAAQSDNEPDSESELFTEQDKVQVINAFLCMPVSARNGSSTYNLGLVSVVLGSLKTLGRYFLLL